MAHDQEAYEAAKRIVDKYWPANVGATRGLNEALVRSHIQQAVAMEFEHLRSIISAYVADENRFNRGEGEAYGSITTETGMRARAVVGNN